MSKKNEEETRYCPHACNKRDCDGDWATYCLTTKPCGYKRNAIDCDRDVISFCTKEGACP
jgi:hypothetical protein